MPELDNEQISFHKSISELEEGRRDQWLINTSGNLYALKKQIVFLMRVQPWKKN
jgi:hypothetical protein